MYCSQEVNELIHYHLLYFPCPKATLNKFVNLIFHRFKEAWMYCTHMSGKESWLELGRAAMSNLDIEFGLYVSPLCASMYIYR